MQVMGHGLFVLFLLPALAGCSGFFEDKQPLGIALHYGFHADNVEVWVNDELVYVDQVTTNHVLGLAGGRRLELKEGVYWVTVFVNDRLVGSEFYTLHHPLFIGVDYKAADGNATFLESRKPFVYF